MPHERATRTLRALRVSLTEARDRAYTELPQIKFYDIKAGHERWFNQLEVDPVVKGPIDAATKDLEDQQGDREAWHAGNITLDDYYGRLYNRVQLGIRRAWEVHLHIATGLYVGALRARTDGVQHLTGEQHARARQDIDKRLTGTAHARALAELDQRYREQGQAEFKRVALDFRRAKDHLKKVRIDWGAESWAWVDFATMRSMQERNVHGFAAYNFEQSIQWNFNARSGHATALTGTYFFHGDRIITKFPSHQWYPASSPYPDIEVRGEPWGGVLRLHDLGPALVADLRRPASEAPLRSLRAKSVGFGAEPPEEEVREAGPNALVRVVAGAEGVAALDRTRVLEATVVNPKTGKELKITLLPRGQPAVLFASDPIHIAPHGAERDADWVTIEACPGEELVARIGERSGSMRVVPTLPDDIPEICAAPQAPPRFTLTALTPTKWEFDPDYLWEYRDYLSGTSRLPTDARGADMIDPPTVLFRDDRGQPLSGTGIAWVFPERREALVSYTDEKGIARLDFRVGERGTFTAFVDGMPSSNPIPDGVQKIIAMPTDTLFTSLLVDGPVRFDIDFVRPTVLDFIDKRGGQPGALIGGDSFYVRVHLGRRDALKVGKAPSIEVRIDPPIWLRSPMLIEAKRTAVPNIYESQLRTGIRTRPGITEAMQPGLLVDPNDIVTASFGQAKVGIKVYDSELDLARERAASGLAFWRDALAATRGTAQRDAARVAVLADMVENGLGWLNDPKLPKAYAVAAASVYLPLLESGANVRPFPAAVTIEIHGSRPRRLSSELEREAVLRALAEAYREDPTRTGNRLVRVGGTFVDFVVNLPDMLFVQPVLGGYTALSGWSAEGELATTFERVMGGFDALLLVAEAPRAIAGAAKGAAGAVRAARSSVTRSIVAEGAFSSSLSLARSLGASAGSALARKAPAYVQDVVLQIAMEELVAGADDAPPESVMTAQAGAAATDWTQPVLVAQRRRPRLERLTTRVDARLRYASERSRERLQATAEMRRHAPGTSEHELARKRAEHLQRTIDYHHRIADRAAAAIPEAAARNVSVEQLMATRPSSRTMYKGSPVYWHYEQQVMRSLGPDDLDLPTTGWRRGASRGLPSGFQSFLSEGFIATAKDPTEYRMRRATRSAIPDHYNEITKDVADSKYYHFDGMSQKAKEGAAKEIADTITKARIYQGLVIKQELHANRNHPAWRMSPAQREDWITKQAIKHKVVIFTPEPMPPDVQKMIRDARKVGQARRMVDAGEIPIAAGERGSKIIFRHVGIQPETW